MNIKPEYLKAEYSNPFNYTGSKHRYLKELFEVLPRAADKNLKVLDPFVGGGDLISKLPKAWSITASDISNKVIGLHLAVQSGLITVESISSEFDNRGMSKINEPAFLDLRREYNESPSADKLYLLMTNSFNNQLRFNLKGGFNMPFGKNRSSFNKRMKSKLSNYQRAIKGRYINFVNMNYSDINFCDFDLVLIDPPYSNTTATYNESTGWAEKQDIALFNKIDLAVESDTKFVYFNQLIANDIKNHELDAWIKKYKVRILKTTTDRCASTKKKGRNTVEIMVWN